MPVGETRGRSSKPQLRAVRALENATSRAVEAMKYPNLFQGLTTVSL